MTPADLVAEALAHAREATADTVHAACRFIGLEIDALEDDPDDGPGGTPLDDVLTQAGERGLLDGDDDVFFVRLDVHDAMVAHLAARVAAAEAALAEANRLVNFVNVAELQDRAEDAETRVKELEEVLKHAHEVDAVVFNTPEGREDWNRGAYSLTRVILLLEKALNEQRTKGNA